MGRYFYMNGYMESADFINPWDTICPMEMRMGRGPMDILILTPKNGCLIIEI